MYSPLTPPRLIEIEKACVMDKNKMQLILNPDVDTVLTQLHFKLLKREELLVIQKINIIKVWQAFLPLSLCLLPVVLIPFHQQTICFSPTHRLIHLWKTSAATAKPIPQPSSWSIYKTTSSQITFSLGSEVVTYSTWGQSFPDLVRYSRRSDHQTTLWKSSGFTRFMVRRATVREVRMLYLGVLLLYTILHLS